MQTSQIKVLDHGFVRLVDSMPTEDGAGDTRIVDAARVSDADSKRIRSDDGLIRYLIRNRHTTPLEQVIYTLHVKCPISVARQFMRHRTFSFNESSTRYRLVPDEFYVPDAERMRKQDTKNRQGSAEELIDDVAAARTLMEGYGQIAHETYKSLLGMGLAREVARGVLPLDTYTEMYATVDLHNLMHFLGLRLEAHAQWEIRQYAQTIEELCTPLAPVAFSAWHELILGDRLED